MSWLTSAGVVRRATAAVRSLVLTRGSRAVAMAWATSPAVWRAATSRASWSTTLLSAYVVATLASVALLAEAMLLFIAAVVGWLLSFRSTEAGVLLPSTSTWRASRADWLALAARPRVRLVLTAVRPEALAAMRPSAAARSLARA